VRLLLHAITSKAELETTLVGVTDDVLTAWTSQVATDASPTREDMLAHHRSVTTIFMKVEACLPARFPTLFADENALRDELAARRAALIQQLDNVRGACELAVTVVWTSAEPQMEEDPTLSPGRRYLLRRAGSERRRTLAERLAETLEREVGADLVSAQRQVCPSAEIALSSALLVRRMRADAIKNRLGVHLPQGVRILVNGPWPPYSFADARSTV
jgi:hypothetical protein